MAAQMPATSIRDQQRRDKGGYLAAVLGSLLGACLLGGGGLLLGLLYVRLFTPHAELGALIPILIGLYAGLLSGTVVGCWWLLRHNNHSCPARTALACGALTLLGLPLLVLANSTLYAVFQIGGPVVSVPLMVMLLIAAALLARRLTSGR